MTGESGIYNKRSELNSDLSGVRCYFTGAAIGLVECVLSRVQEYHTRSAQPCGAVRTVGAQARIATQVPPDLVPPTCLIPGRVRASRARS